jgi:hypothetical protein
MKDPRIQVDPGLRKQIATIVCTEIKNSLGSNSKVYDKARRCENQYNQVTKWMELGKVCSTPWPGAADYFVALSEWIVDAIYARLMSILFSQEPYMKASGADVASVANQDNATDFVDQVFRDKVNLYENTNFFFKQMIKLPMAVLKYDWVEDYDGKISKAQAQTFTGPNGEQEQMLPDDPEGMIKSASLIANGYQQAEQQEVWVYEDVEIYSGPKAQYINITDYVWTPGTKRGEKPYWEGDRCWFTINDMLLKVRQEKFDSDAVARIKTSTGSGLSGNDLILKQRETPVECFHWYGRLPFNNNGEIDLANPDTIEQEVYCLVSLKEEELLDIMMWPYERYPAEERVYIRGEFEETTEFEGRSMIEKLYKTQQELNDLHNTIQNNAWIAMQKIFVKRKSLVGDEYEKPKVFPGAMWEEDTPGDIRVLEMGDVKAVGFELEQTLLSFAERISNISNWNLGTQKEQGKATATEFMGVVQEGNIGREPFLQRCYKILSKLCDWTVEYYKGRIQPGMERTMGNGIGGRILPSPQNMPMYQQKGIQPEWSDELLTGKFHWDWQGTSLNSDKQWNIMVDNDLMNMYIPQPMISGNLLAVWTIMKKGLIDRGVKNWEEILPKKENIIAEMQRMAQEAQMRKAMPGAQLGQRLPQPGMAQAVQQQIGGPGGVPVQQA